MTDKPTYEELIQRVQELEREKEIRIIRDAEFQIRHVFDRIEGMAILGFGRNRTVTYWNKSTEVVFGYTRDEAIGRKLEDLIIPPADHGKVIKDVKKWYEEGVAIPADEMELVGKGGKAVYVHSSYVMVANSSGEREVFWIEVDLSGIKAVEKELRESEAQKKVLLDSSLDSIRLVDRDMRIIWSNRIIEAQVGGDRDKITGNFCYKAYTGRDKPCPNCPTLKALKSGKTEHSIIVEKDVKGIPGTTYWADYAVPMKDESGKIVRFLQVSRDITDLKKAEIEKEMLISDLKEALSKVKTLSGLLPICSACKKIRNDEGYWNQIESYIQEHSDAVFTHGICPDCVKLYYSGVGEKLKDSSE